ncbi:MAG: PilC/PilY family type IV pilus protein [Rhodoferax sp.]|nr:PilC/PilY family type IV pilus protein [Rhodoferax sp.]
MKDALPVFQTPRVINHCCLAVVCLLAQSLSGVSQAQVLGPSPETSTPVHAAKGGTPLVMLTMARDNTLFFPAYNDLSDLDGDKKLDIRFKPEYEYVGLYNPHYCYKYTGSGNTGYFYPDGLPNTVTPAGKPVPGPCSASNVQSTRWSGNFLNYVTTSRMDALRVALYGGTREPETASDTSTVLRRAYIPQDGHAWAKEYASVSEDGYDISRYTTLAVPTSTSRRHFFGSLTSTAAVNPAKTYTYQIIDGVNDYPPVGVACATLNNCSSFPPLLRVIQNSDRRVWEWVSSERPVLTAVKSPKSYGGDAISYGAGTLTDYTVRVQVCFSTFLKGCKKYPNGYYKPIGVLHDYGENESMYFGLLTGSYDQNLTGGRLRKNIGTFKDEIDSTTGRFLKPTSSTTSSIVAQIDNIRIRNFNYKAGPNADSVSTANPPELLPWYSLDNFLYRNGREDLSPYSGPTPSKPYESPMFNNSYGKWGTAVATRHVMVDGEYADWGNPVAEMMYEGLRYFAGAAATPAYNAKVGGATSATTEDEAVGLASVTWKDPYTDANWCAKPSQMVISSVNPSFDSDQLPGSNFGTMETWTTNNATLDVKTLTNTIGDKEEITDTTQFIGSSNGVDDGAPTLKAVPTLGTVRGLPPDDANKQGSYYAAAVAYFGKSNTLRKVNNRAIPNVDTFAVMMNQPIPSIEIPFADNKKITVVPFARSIDVASLDKDGFQPNNAIVGMYITSIVKEDNDNGNGGYHIKFYINFEDRQWGGDFEMDAIAEYDILATSEGVTIEVKPTYYASANIQNMGYVISGVKNADGDVVDGTYLVVQSRTAVAPYFLNVPPDKFVGHCNTTPMPDECKTLPNKDDGTSSTKTFKVNSADTSVKLKDPLWYAAKWGGYVGQAPTGPTTADPANYAQVGSPAKLKATFTAAFQSILDRSSTIGAVAASSSQLLTDTKLYQASFNQKYFTGDLTATAFKVTKGTGNDPDVSSYSWAWVKNAQPQSAASMLLEKNEGARNIYYKNPSSGATNLLSFTTSTATLDIGKNSFSSDLVNYLRGNTSQEMRNGGNFRDRGLPTSANGTAGFAPNVLGSIINSAPVYFDSTKTVYVGANDGMLHGFDSETGEERFAYIPSAVIPHLTKLSEPFFTHRYYVDGDIAVMGGSKTGGVNYLVGFLGRGAKGLYGLRVNNTGVVTDAGAWENLGAGDDDMGYLLGSPVTGYLADGTAVAVFGNGYNSVNNKAVLYVVRLSDGTVLKKFKTDSDPGNGLSTPGVVLNDGKLRYAYAGDYRGDVWKFDLSGITGGATLADGDGIKIWDGWPEQPIVSAVAVGTDNTKQQFIFFGSGSDLTVTDATSSETQSIRGLIDSGTMPITFNNISLRQRFLHPTTGTNNNLQVRSFYLPQTGDMAGMRGWYLNWPNLPAPSEKVFTAPSVRNTSTPALVVSTNIVNSNSCSGTGVGFLNAMDAFRGGGLPTSYFDMNRDRAFDNNDKLNGLAVGSINFGIGNIGQASFPGNNVVVQGNKEKSDEQGSGGASAPSDNKGDKGTEASGQVSRRISWREIVK